MSKIIAGIDFGTSNTAASMIDTTGVARMVELEQGRYTMPSAMFFDADSKQVYYGTDAEKQNALSPTTGRMMRAIKSILGTDLMGGTTAVNGKMVSYLEIIRDFLLEIKLSIDIQAQTNVDSVVLGRPVHFTHPANIEEDLQAEKALRKIAQNLGFKNIAFQYEPIAAAFTYEQGLLSDQEKLALVVDIGGGTSDFSVIKLSGTRKNDLNRHQDILANTGIRIGGKDFDEKLSKHIFMPLFGRGGQYEEGGKRKPLPTAPYDNLSSWNKIKDLYDKKTLDQVHKYINIECQPRCLHRLCEIIENKLGHIHLAYVEQTKINLSSNDTVNATLDYINDRPSLSVTRSNFETCISTDVKNIQDTMLQCVHDANVSPCNIDLIILTGGSSQIPYIINMVRHLFPNAEISSTDTMTSVGMGLAYDALRHYQSNKWD